MIFQKSKIKKTLKVCDLNPPLEWYCIRWFVWKGLLGNLKSLKGAVHLSREDSSAASPGLKKQPWWCHKGYLTLGLETRTLQQKVCITNWGCGREGVRMLSDWMWVCALHHSHTLVCFCCPFLCVECARVSSAPVDPRTVCAAYVYCWRY